MLTLVLVLSCISGITFHLGGLGDDYWMKHKKWPRWMFNTLVRDLGSSFLTTVAISLKLHFVWWAALIHWGLLYWALTTYWGFLNHKEKTWWTWLFTGTFYGVCALPYLWCGLSLCLFMIRCAALAVFTMAWRTIQWPWTTVQSDANWDEVGSGVSIPLSTIIL